MGIFFSKKEKEKTSRVTQQDKAVLQLKQTRDKLKQYQKKIEQNIERDRELAKKLVNSNRKQRALLLLRKKKYQEQILVKTDSQLDNLEIMVHDIEFAQIETKVIDGLKVGNEALKKLHEILSIDEIEKVMEETSEGLEKQEELDRLLSGVLTEEDEDLVEAELEQLLSQDDKVIDSTESDLILPEVPADKLPDKKEQKAKSEKTMEVAF